jgi:hypothetical protein
MWGISGMIRIALGLLLLLADLVYIREFWALWSYLPLTSLFWSAIFGGGLFIKQGKMADFIWVLIGISALAIISGGLIMEASAVKILIIQVLFGFFAGTVVGAGVLEYRLSDKSEFSRWFNIGSLITGVGCLILVLLAMMDYFFDSKFLEFFKQHALIFNEHDNTVISTSIVISILFSAAIGFLFSYGLQFSLFAMLFLLIGVFIAFSFHGVSFDLFFSCLGIILGFVFGSSIGSGVRRIGDLIKKNNKK